MDTVSRRVRSKIMAAVPQEHSEPEMIVRRIAHGMGLRFRLHRRDLPGSPDLVFPRSRKAIFVHGCFWHRHGCRRTTTPSSNADFWHTKFETNRRRDRRVIRELKSAGWEVLIVWECQTPNVESLRQKLRTFMSNRVSTQSAVAVEVAGRTMQNGTV